MPSPGPKSKHFQLTLNEIERYDKLKGYLTGLKTNNYFISCLEKAPTTGHEHIHIYAQFNQQVRLGITKTEGAHIEVCRGTPQENVEYIRKDGTILDEIGTLRLTGNPTIRDIKSMSPQEVDELPWNIYNVATKIVDEEHDKKSLISMLEEIKRDELKAPRVIYIIGDPNAGKTYGAFKLALSMFDVEDIGTIEINNNFFKITNKEAKCFVIQEFRSSQCHPTMLLQLLDKYGYNCPIKGGFTYLRPEAIIIASIIPPTKLYSEDKQELNSQFTRRVTELYTARDHKLYPSHIEKHAGFSVIVTDMEPRDDL